MNPTVRAVGNPIAFRRKVDLIAFICVPDRFAAPVHRLCASSKEGLDHPFLSLTLYQCPMTPISLIAKNFNRQVASCSPVLNDGPRSGSGGASYGPRSDCRNLKLRPNAGSPLFTSPYVYGANVARKSVRYGNPLWTRQHLQ